MMSDIVLEQRVSDVEKNLIRISKKMELYGEESYERLTRLEDWLIQYSAANQKAIEESQRWRLEMEESHRKNEQEFQKLWKIVTANQEESQKWRKSMEEDRRESKKELKELRKTIADSRKELGQISHRLGTIVEDLVAPSLPRVLKEMVNCPTEDDVLINVRVRRRHPTQKGKMLEIDAMADCGNYVLFNETKSQFSPEKVKAFLDKLALVRDYFPEYQHHQIRGCIASLYLDKSLIDYASRQGLLALASGEYLMTIQNETGFSWKAF
jgi:seryl-tRNA synthetase